MSITYKGELRVKKQREVAEQYGIMLDARFLIMGTFEQDVNTYNEIRKEYMQYINSSELYNVEFEEI